MRRALGLSAALLAGLAGCTLGPDWKKPSPGLPDHFTPAEGSAVSSTPTAATAAPDWWRLFNDPTLTALEEQVAASNLDVAEAGYRVAQGRALLTEAGAARYPTLGASASYAHERASPNGIMSLLGTTDNESASTVAGGSAPFGVSGISGSSQENPVFNLWQYGLDASWELDLWGKARRETEAARAEAQETAEMRRGALVSAQAELARDYITLRAVQAERAITAHNLADAEHNLALTRLRYANGTGTRLDLANAGAEVSSIRATLPDLDNQSLLLINALSYLLGEPPRSLMAKLQSPAPVPPAPPSPPMGLPSALAAERPDIRAAAAALHAATARIGAAQADFYPQITLGTSFGLQALDAADLGLWSSRQFGLGPSISLPIFEGGRLRGQLALRQAQAQQAALAYRQTVLGAWHEVDDALNTYAAAQRQHAALADAVAQNETALAAARLQYTAGAADFLNVLTVQDRLLAAQRALVQATQQTDLALIGLYNALGGGWQQTFPEALPKLADAGAAP